uniref:Uncharacterized protein n=1 Tax=Euplotes crassus TaxID=5936 RepID=A0A7S3KCP3_EUPCR
MTPDMPYKTLYFPAKYSLGNLQKRHWAEVLNIIVLVIEGLLLLGFGSYFADVNNKPAFSALVMFHVTMFILNVVFYIVPQSKLVRDLLGFFSIASFFVFGLVVIYVVASISGPSVDTIGAILLGAFVGLPTFILGLSAWIALRETARIPTVKENFGQDSRIQYLTQDLEF